MVEFIQLPVVQALAWALVHFLWQGAAIALAAVLAFRLAPRSASARYAIGVGALAAMAAAPVATFLTLAAQPAAPVASTLQWPVAVEPAATPAAAIVWSVDIGSAVVTPTLRVSPDVLAGAVLVWFAGVLFFGVRLFGGWIVARRMAGRAVRPASESVQALARQLADRLHVDRVVMVFESAVVSVPVMVGWLKPAVVLPMAALAGLNPAQMEALLAHELAHVRRHDYLVNLLQSAAEALLFYHPAVWWLSGRVRAERELCCDDLAMGVCDRLIYATALTDLAAMTSPRVALAATDGDLLARVRRILGQPDAAPALRAGVMPVLALVLVAGAAVSVAFASATASPASNSSSTPSFIESRAEEPAATAALADQAPARVEPAPSVELAFDQLALEQTPEQTAERQRQVEDLRKVLEQMAAELKARSGQETSPQVTEQYKLTLEKYRKLLDQITVAAARDGQFQGDVADRYKQALAQEAERAALANKQLFDQVELSQAARNAALTEARRQMEEAKRQFEAGLVSQQQVMEAQRALQRAEAAGNAQAQGAIDAREAEARLARAKALFDKGLMTEQQVREAELAMAKVRAAGNAEALNEVQIQDVLAKLAREKELNEKGLATQQSVADQEAALKALMERLRERGDVRAEQSAADRERMAASARQLYELLERRRTGINAEPAAGVNDRNLVAVADAAALVKGGDVLRVTIDGEPDLPNSFKVSADGTIRMPFLGSVKVVGLTAANVRAAVGKLLSDRKLGSVSQVTVTLLRSR